MRSTTTFAITLLVLLTFSSVFAGETKDYCKIKCTDDGVTTLHTMCKYLQDSPSKACTGLVNSGLTSKEKQTILDLHNEMRQKVASGKEIRGSPGPQPAAKSMSTLEWDEELTNIAQRWAYQCDFNHDCSDVDRFSVGQNIGQAWSSPPEFPTIEELIQEWYDEVEFCNSNEISKYRDEEEEDIGHYTQLVWAETKKIGCGLTRYFDKEEEMNTAILVCNYGPAGNRPNKPVYEKI